MVERWRKQIHPALAKRFRRLYVEHLGDRQWGAFAGQIFAELIG